MQEHVRWSAVLIVPRGDQFLALASGFRPRDTNFPGGDSSSEDRTPEETAVRQLYEETGLRAAPEDMNLLDQWVGSNGQDVYAYVVGNFTGRVRSSSEGKVFWTANMGLLTSRSAQHNESARHLLLLLKRVAA